MFVGNYWVKDRILNVCLHACRISSLKFFRFDFWYKEMDRMLYLCDGNLGETKSSAFGLPGYQLAGSCALKASLLVQNV